MALCKEDGWRPTNIPRWVEYVPELPKDRDRQDPALSNYAAGASLGRPNDLVHSPRFGRMNSESAAPTAFPMPDQLGPSRHAAIHPIEGRGSCRTRWSRCHHVVPTGTFRRRFSNRSTSPFGLNNPETDDDAIARHGRRKVRVEGSLHGIDEENRPTMR